MCLPGQILQSYFLSQMIVHIGNGFLDLKCACLLIVYAGRNSNHGSSRRGITSNQPPIYLYLPTRLKKKMNV